MFSKEEIEILNLSLCNVCIKEIFDHFFFSLTLRQISRFIHKNTIMKHAWLMLHLLYNTKLEVLNVLGWKWRGEVHGKEGQKNEKLSVYITSIMIFILMISSSYG